MKTHLSAPRASAAGFSLIELLVVIAIIGILAGLLLPVLSVLKTKAKIARAKTEMANLRAAIMSYHAAYVRMPASREAEVSPTDSSPDFTFGAVLKDGTRIVTTGNQGYQTNNAELMTILTDRDEGANSDHRRNPRKIVFFTPNFAVDVNSPGLGPDGVFRDPWGNPYIVTVDMNGDGVCQDGFYYPLTKGPNPLLLRASVMIWCFGPDGRAVLDRGLGPKQGVNKDNILGWE